MKRDGGHSSDGFPSEDFWLRFPRSENVFRAHDQALKASPSGQENSGLFSLVRFPVRLVNNMMEESRSKGSDDFSLVSKQQQTPLEKEATP